MHVLLLTHNRTVEEMVSLAFRELEGFVFSHGEDAGMIGSDDDIVIVDDTFPPLHEAWLLAQKFQIRHTVLLAQGGSLEEEAFGYRITKPFLPEEIASLMMRIRDDETVTSTEIPFQKKKKNKKKYRKKKEFEAETEVLNLEEIETIKTLLEQEGLEIVHEEELAEKVLSAERPHELQPTDRHDALLEALRTMKAKKIRKLLKGATVSIEIHFPEERQ